MASKSLQQRDQAHIWHPLTQHQTSDAPIGIVQAKGAVLYDEEGNEYIDGIASWYTAMYGHCNPQITSRVSQQLLTLDQVVFTGFTHAPAVELSEKLITILPSDQQEWLYLSSTTCSGSTRITR